MNNTDIITNIVNTLITTNMNTPQTLLAHLRNAETNHIGFSYNINTGDSNPETGYMVSQKGYEQTAPQGCDLVAYGRNYFLLHAEQLADPTAYMGCWYNGGQFVFDISHNIETMDNAIEVGMTNDQDAIWDCASGSEYRLMREGDMGCSNGSDADLEYAKKMQSIISHHATDFIAMIETLAVSMDELNQIYNHSASNEFREYYEMHMNQLDNIITLINKLK